LKSNFHRRSNTTLEVTLLARQVFEKP